jgi:hypothetical protein
MLCYVLCLTFVSGFESHSLHSVSLDASARPSRSCRDRGTSFRLPASTDRHRPCRCALDDEPAVSDKPVIVPAKQPRQRHAAGVFQLRSRLTDKSIEAPVKLTLLVASVSAQVIPVPGAVATAPTSSITGILQTPTGGRSIMAP